MVERRELHNSAVTAVAQTALSNGYMVSTVVLDNPMTAVLDSIVGNFLVDEGRADLTTPGSYETMVFDYDWDEDNVTSWTERDFQRYHTEEEARKGHEKMVEKFLKA